VRRCRRAGERPAEMLGLLLGDLRQSRQRPSSITAAQCDVAKRVDVVVALHGEVRPEGEPLRCWCRLALAPQITVEAGIRSTPTVTPPSSIRWTVIPVTTLTPSRSSPLHSSQMVRERPPASADPLRSGLSSPVPNASAECCVVVASDLMAEQADMAGGRPIFAGRTTTFRASSKLGYRVIPARGPPTM
jgi:hypothetical protein